MRRDDVGRQNLHREVAFERQIPDQKDDGEPTFAKRALYRVSISQRGTKTLSEIACVGQSLDMEGFGLGRTLARSYRPRS